MSTSTINVVSNETPEQNAALQARFAEKIEAADASEAAPAKAGKQAKTATDSEPGEQEQEGTESQEGDGEEEGSDPAKAGKPKGGFQRKIDKLTKRNKQTEAELARERAERAAERAELERLRAGGKADEPKKEQPKAVETSAFSKPKPVQEKFDSHEEWVEALTEWKIDKREFDAAEAVRQKQKEAAKQTEQERWTGVLGKYNASIEAAQEKYDDFDEVIESLGKLHIPGHIVQYLYEAQDGAGDLAYALAGKHRAELERISKLHPSEALRALAKFEAKHLPAAEETTSTEEETASESEDEDEAPKTKKITKAPDPIKPVGANGRSQTETSVYDEGLSFKEFEARELKRLAKKRA